MLVYFVHKKINSQTHKLLLCCCVANRCNRENVRSPCNIAHEVLSLRLRAARNFQIILNLSHLNCIPDERGEVFPFNAGKMLLNFRWVLLYRQLFRDAVK